MQEQFFFFFFFFFLVYVKNCFIIINQYSSLICTFFIYIGYILFDKLTYRWTVLTGTPELYASTLTIRIHQDRYITYEFLAVVYGTCFHKLLTHLDFFTWLIFSLANLFTVIWTPTRHQPLITVTTIITFYVCTFTRGRRAHAYLCSLYIHTHIHTYAYTYTHIDKHTHTYTYICTYTHTDIHIYTYIHTHTHTYIYMEFLFKN